MTILAHCDSRQRSALAYRPDIDGLRALAVSAVIGFHLSPSKIPGGFIGVDVFFVISGFLISSIIYIELQTGNFGILDFYIRRVRRIYPTLLIVLVLAALAGWWLLLPSEYIHLGKQIAGGSAFVANLVLGAQTDYLTDPVERVPLLHLWSLGIEEQFYLIFPLLCAVFYRARSDLALMLVFTTLALATMAANVHLAVYDRAADFYMPYTRLWELFIGAGLSLHRHRVAGPQQRMASHNVAGVLGVAMVLDAIVLLNRVDPYPGVLALVPCVGTALIIWAGPAAWINKYVLASKPLVYVGLISYPLYMWHWPILSFLRIAYGYGVDDTPGWGKLVVVVGSLLLAAMTYHFVEKPIRRFARGRWRKIVAIGLLGSVALVGLFGLAVVATDGFPGRYPSAIAMLDHDYDLNSSMRGGRCFLSPNQSAASFADACVDPPGQSSRPLMVLWGDSHLADLYFGLKAMQTASPIRMAQFTASNCPPIIGFERWFRPYCRSINEAVFDRIKLMKPDIVVMSAEWNGMGLPLRPATRQTGLEGLAFTIRTLKSIGISRVVVIGSAPIWSQNVPALLINELRSDPARPLPLSLPRSLLRGDDDSKLEAAAEQSGAVYVPLIPNLCDADRCQVTTGPYWQDVLTFDEAHFTERGSVFVVRRIYDQVIGHPQNR